MKHTDRRAQRYESGKLLQVCQATQKFGGLCFDVGCKISTYSIRNVIGSRFEVPAYCVRCHRGKFDICPKFDLSEPAESVRIEIAIELRCLVTVHTPGSLFARVIDGVVSPDLGRPGVITKSNVLHLGQVCSQENDLEFPVEDCKSFSVDDATCLEDGWSSLQGEIRAQHGEGAFDMHPEKVAIYP